LFLTAAVQESGNFAHWLAMRGRVAAHAAIVAAGLIFSHRCDRPATAVLPLFAAASEAGLRQLKPRKGGSNFLGALGGAAGRVQSPAYS